MKKLLSVFLLIVLVLSFTSCSKDKNENKSDKLSVVATIYPYYDFAKNILGDKGDVKLLLSPGTEPHHFEPSPSDIVDIEDCDIFIYNGGESDEWVENVLKSIENKDIQVLKMMDYVDLLCIEEEHTHSDDKNNDSSKHSHNHEHGEYDEHIWTSINNAMLISSVIYDNVSNIDIEHSDFYKSNFESYCNKLIKLDNEFNNIVSLSKRKTIVFGDRFPLLYFTNDYNIDYVSAFPGCSSETEPSISTITHLIDFVRDENIPVIFHLDFSSGKIAKLISEDSNAKVELFYSCHNVTTKQFENGESYISLMKHNAEVLKEALL